MPLKLESSGRCGPLNHGERGYLKYTKLQMGNGGLPNLTPKSFQKSLKIHQRGFDFCLPVTLLAWLQGLS